MIPMAATGDDAGWICAAGEVRDAFSVLSPAYTRHSIGYMTLNWSNSARPAPFSTKLSLNQLNPTTKQLLAKKETTRQSQSQMKSQKKRQSRGQSGTATK